MANKKFNVLKPVLHGGAVQKAGTTIELDADAASTKSLITTKHIAAPTAPAKKEDQTPKDPTPPTGETGPKK